MNKISENQRAYFACRNAHISAIENIREIFMIKSFYIQRF